MQEDFDIRWKQRFSNYKKAVGQLTEFIEKGELNKFEEQGLIQCFEYTYELSWNLMRDYLTYQGFVKITGSRDAIRISFNNNLIEDGENWMKMVDDRIRSVHTYNQETADDIQEKIYQTYYHLFIDLKIKMETFL
ncbi:MAG: nucleotidyltransferase [Sphingobacteriaceae bacterium]|nr:MAG: nucleotidyltransferase [Sphingobacteriaceae bacterium]